MKKILIVLIILIVIGLVFLVHSKRKSTHIPTCSAYPFNAQTNEIINPVYVGVHFPNISGHHSVFIGGEVDKKKRRL